MHLGRSHLAIEAAAVGSVVGAQPGPARAALGRELEHPWRRLLGALGVLVHGLIEE
tara:strand:- start:53 stop:220 length:168 start_codon:yes stop_codon:yes gene_type:complete